MDISSYIQPCKTPVKKRAVQGQSAERVPWRAHEDNVTGFCYMGMPQQRTAYDPWAYEMFMGTEKPNPRGWVEPNLTDHLFFIKPESTVKVIKVSATDPFGNVYTDSLKLNT